MSPTDWSWSPDAVVAPLLLAAYLLAVRGRAQEDGRGRLRLAAFAAGCVLIAAALVTPLDTIARHYLVWAHLLQNVVLAEWAPALLVLGLPASLAAALTRSRVARLVTRPYVALPAWLVTYAVWHVPALYDAALRNPGWLLPIEHLSYLLVGLLVWWPVVHSTPHGLPSGGRAAYVFAAFVASAPLGVLLALVTDPIYDAYADAPERLWGLSRLADQQLGGVTMAGEQSIVFFFVFAYWFLRFLGDEDVRDTATR